MAFQDDLRAYLERLLDEGPEAPRSWFKPDVRLHRQHLLRELERLDAAGTDKERLTRLHVYWSDRLESFATKMGTQLVNGLAHGAPTRDVTDLINIALSRRLDLKASTGSFIKDAEIDRLSLHSRGAGSADGLAVDQYSLEIRAVRGVGDRRQLTPLGRIALELPDRDVLRWLLTAEVVQSRGSHDEWRLSRTAAAELRRRPHGFLPNSLDEGDVPFPAEWTTMMRLSEMGILSLEDVRDDDTGECLGDRYEVAQEALPILGELASGQDTPFAVLIAALLSDETNATLDPLRPSTARITAETAATATTRHARMVAHEIRNALVPVQRALDKLYRDAKRQGNEAVLAGHRDAID